MSRSWLFLTIPIALLAIALLTRTAFSLLRTVRGSVLASVRIRAEQEVTLSSSGALALDLESPVLTARPANLRFALSSTAQGSPIELRPMVIRTSVTSMSRSRLELYSFSIPTPGTYTLRIDGIDPAADYSSHAVLITRQYGGALILHVLALVALGALLIGSIVVSGLVLSGKSFSPESSGNSQPPFTQSS